MPELNLFLFLSLAMAGILTIHLYRMDVRAQEEGTDPPAQHFEPEYANAARRHHRPSCAVLTMYPDFPADFIEVACASGWHTDRSGHIETDFILGTRPCIDNAEESVQIRCA